METQCLKITEKVSFSIAIGASYVYIWGHKSLLKMPKIVNLESLWNHEAFGQTVLPDRTNLVENVKIEISNETIWVIFKHCVKWWKAEKRKPKGPIFLFSGKQNFIEFDSRWREKSATQTVKCQLNPMCSRATMAKSVVTICENSPSCHFTWLVVLELWIYAIMSFSITTGYMPKSQQYPSWTF